ncbi:MAG: glycosyltransferase [Verrucomicrobia bacterium]|nr:glycosyltransferase [Verrucomicrobiota bacterium]
MSTRPLISIVLPTYNGSRYLAASVASVLRQSYPHWELLLQDDCSTDGTPELIARLAAGDSRIKPVRNSVNLRLPNSLNAGFARAAGEFLTWTSDDNEYRPEALEAMLGLLTSDPAAGLVYCDMTYMDDDGRPQEAWVAPEPETIGSTNPVGGCFLYRRTVLDLVGGYDDRWRLVEDWEYWIRVAMRFPIRALHRDLYLYRRHAGSLTTTRAAEVRRIRLAMLSERVPQLPVTSRHHRAVAYLHLARMATEQGDAVQASAFHRKALRLDPVRSSLVVAARRLLGPEGAGTVRQWWRRRFRGAA